MMGCICSNIQFMHKVLDYMYISLPRGTCSVSHTESNQRIPSIRTYTGSVGIKDILDVHFQSGALVKTELILFFTTIHVFCEDSVPTNNMVSLKKGPKRTWRLLLIVAKTTQWLLFLPKRLGGFYCCQNDFVAPIVAKTAWRFLLLPNRLGSTYCYQNGLVAPVVAKTGLAAACRGSLWFFLLYTCCFFAGLDSVAYTFSH